MPSYELAAKIQALKPYDPIMGNYRIRLDANESFYELPPEVIQKIQKKIGETAFQRYPDPNASQACRAFCQLYGVSEDCVTAANGSDELISILCSCFLEKGEKILTVRPDFSMYSFYGSLYETQIETVSKGESYQLDVDQLISECAARNPRMLIFSNPCNPTSLGITRQEMLRLLRSVSCLVVADEAYMDFWTESVMEDVNDFDHLIILRTCSKALGLAAIRMGFAVTNPKLTQALRAVKSPYNTDSLSQAAAAAVLSEKELYQEHVKGILKSRDQLYTGIQELQKLAPALERVYPTVTNFVMVKIAQAEAVWKELLHRSIAVRWMGEHLRITAGSPDETRTVLAELETILKNT